jgi:hypothetical protein
METKDFTKQKLIAVISPDGKVKTEVVKKHFDILKAKGWKEDKDAKK